MRVNDEEQAVLEYLRSSSIFDDLGEEGKLSLAPIAGIVRFPIGSKIIAEGENNHKVFFMLSGIVAVYASGEHILELKHENDIFGEMSVISDSPCSATIVAETDVKVLTLEVKQVNRSFENNTSKLKPVLYKLFAKILTEKLKTTTIKAKKYETTNKKLVETANELQYSLNQLKLVNKECRMFVPTPFLNLLETEDKSYTIEEVGELISAEEEEITVLVANLHYFSSLTSNHSAKDTFNFLNEHLKMMNPYIIKHQGYIDNFLGSSIQAIFKSAEDACQAAILMQDKIRENNQERVKANLPPIELGIGISTGKGIFGLLGTEDRMGATVIGPVVNIASSLEALTEDYSIKILISEDTFEKLESKKYIRKIDKILIRKNEEPLYVYEFYQSDPPVVVEQKVESQDRFKSGIELYMKNHFRAARDHFKKCFQICYRDQVARSYISRCDYLLENPPHSGWDGIFEKRATRFSIDNKPASLSYGFSHEQPRQLAILMKDFSDTGISIIIPNETPLYLGEQVMVDIPIASDKKTNQEKLLKVLCVVRRRQPGPLIDRKATLKFGLQFQGITKFEKELLRNAFINVFPNEEDVSVAVKKWHAV